MAPLKWKTKAVNVKFSLYARRKNRYKEAPMTRMSKKGERRNRSPRKHRPASEKTGPVKDNLPLGYKQQENAAKQTQYFIPKI